MAQVKYSHDRHMAEPVAPAARLTMPMKCHGVLKYEELSRSAVPVQRTIAANTAATSKPA